MKRHWFGLFLIIITIIGTSIFYPYLPEQIAIHWNYNGEPDHFVDKSYGAFLFPGIMVVLYIFRIVLPKIDPNKNNYQRFEGTYYWIMNGLLLFFFLFQVMKITGDLGIINP